VRGGKKKRAEKNAGPTIGGGGGILKEEGLLACGDTDRFANGEIRMGDESLDDNS